MMNVLPPLWPSDTLSVGVGATTTIRGVGASEALDGAVGAVAWATPFLLHLGTMPCLIIVNVTLLMPPLVFSSS